MRIIIFSYIISFVILYFLFYGDIGERCLLSLVVSIPSSIIISFVALAIIILPSDTEEYISNTETIVCLNDSSSVQGNKYLFSGQIRENNIYRMYILNNDNSKNYKEVQSKDSKIYEDGENKIITYNKRVIPKTKFSKWLLNKDLTCTTRYEIHIPNGSITTEFNIDLGN